MASQSRGSYSDPLTPALLAELRAQLAEGERLAWAACPEPEAFEPTAPASVKWDGVMILGGGYATLGACVMAFRSGRWLWLTVPLSVLLFGLLRYLIARWIKQRQLRSLVGTVYGLTTRRALIMHTYPALAVQALPIDTIADVTLLDLRGDFADLCVVTTPASPGLLFRGVAEAERARTQLLRVIRDPQATEEQLAAAEAYAKTMHQLRMRSM